VCDGQGIVQETATMGGTKTDVDLPFIVKRLDYLDNVLRSAAAKDDKRYKDAPIRLWLSSSTSSTLSGGNTEPVVPAWFSLLVGGVNTRRLTCFFLTPSFQGYPFRVAFQLVILNIGMR